MGTGTAAPQRSRSDTQPWLNTLSMHRVGQGESGGQTPIGGEGDTAGDTHPVPRPRGKRSLPDRDAYAGKEGGKEEEYIPSRTVNHAE